MVVLSLQAYTCSSYGGPARWWHPDTSPWSGSAEPGCLHDNLTFQVAGLRSRQHAQALGSHLGISRGTENEAADGRDGVGVIRIGAECLPVRMIHERPPKPSSRTPMSSNPSIYVKLGNFPPMIDLPKNTGWSPTSRKIAISPLSNISTFRAPASSEWLSYTPQFEDAPSPGNGRFEERHPAERPHERTLVANVGRVHHGRSQLIDTRLHVRVVLGKTLPERRHGFQILMRQQHVQRGVARPVEHLEHAGGLDAQAVQGRDEDAFDEIMDSTQFRPVEKPVPASAHSTAAKASPPPSPKPSRRNRAPAVQRAPCSPRTCACS